MTTNVEDPIGQETLESFSQTKRFNQWQYGTVSKYLNGEILEIGSGIGNISTLLLKNNSAVTLSDLRKNYCDILEEKFKDAFTLKKIIQVNLTEPDFEIKHSPLFENFDTIIALNVIEHIQDDGKAMANCRKLLRPGGCLIIQVPAFQWLYNSLDKGLGHYKRYTKKSLHKLITDHGLSIQVSRYFNLAGIPGWWFSGSLLQKKIIPQSQTMIFDKLVPLIRLADIVTINRIGLSLIIVAKKPNTI